MRQIFPTDAELTDPALAERYAYPDPPGGQVVMRANMVASLDGAASLRGRSGGLSGSADRHVFALLRALADVILVGAGTARAEGYGPVRPGTEGTRWQWLREGRTPSPPIAVVTRSLNLDLSSPLLTSWPAHARTIVVTTLTAPPDRRAEAARVAEVIVAGERDVDLRAAAAALARLGHRHILTEGGPQLLSQVVTAGLLDELCLTLSPLVAGAGAGRIVQPPGGPGEMGAEQPRPFTLSHVLADQGHLLCRYLAAPVQAGGALTAAGS